MSKTKIEWAERVWNPVTGCTKVSEGCQNCYAERMSKRLAGRFGYPADDPFRVTVHEDKFYDPAGWRKPSDIFVCSMSDLFHESVSFNIIEQIFEAMRDINWHHFMVLTKRPGRVLEYWTWWQKEYLGQNVNSVWPKHVSLGVTTENQRTADERIPILLQTPAAVRFVSVEPMLERINLNLCHECQVDPSKCHKHNKLDWIICGCESGPGKRSIGNNDIRDLKNQCVEAETPFFLKQMKIGGKIVKMPELDGQVWDQMPDKDGAK